MDAPHALHVIRAWVEKCRPKLIIGTGLTHLNDFLAIAETTEAPHAHHFGRAISGCLRENRQGRYIFVVSLYWSFLSVPGPYPSKNLERHKTVMKIKASPTLAKVEKGELCSGCGLCAGVADGAIELQTVAPGYTRPRQLAPITQEMEKKIATGCPGVMVAPWKGSEGDASRQFGPAISEYWGPYKSVATGHATDEEMRFVASSGGVLSALLVAALESGLIDSVLHVMADPERPTRNVMRWSTTHDEVLSGAGSRYAASSPLADIDSILASGRRFAFVGKPCDVSALRQLATLDPRVDAQVPIMLAFFCGGIPSHAGTDRIIRKLGFQPDDVEHFRYRGHGWPGRAVAVTKTGEQADMSYEESWGGHLSKEVQFRCKICPDAVGGVADIAVADAWYGGETGYPTFEELDGRSLIITRNERGEALFEEAKSRNIVNTEPLDLDHIDLMQPSQAERKRMIAARVAASAVMLQPVPKMKGLLVGKAARQGSSLKLLKNFVGTIRRIVLKRR